MWSALRIIERQARGLPSHACQNRHLSVVAWGCNALGQCGVPSFTPVLLVAEEVEGLRGVSLAALAAGGSHSAAVTADGDVLTFGAGNSGQLGLGKNESSFQPNRVESLVGRASVVQAALGSQHSVFLDSNGSVHTCGGASHFDHASLAQLLGSVEGALALRQHQALEGRRGQSMALPSMERRARRQRRAAASPDAGAAAEAGSAGQTSSGGFGWEGMMLVPMVDHSSRSAELQHAVSMFDDSMHNALARDSAGVVWNQTHGAEAISSIAPASLPFLSPAKFEGGKAAATTANATQEAPVLTSVASCPESANDAVALTATGDVLTMTLSGSPRQQLRSPGRLLAAALERNGGAIGVAAGAGFNAALTAAGRVLVWAASKRIPRVEGEVTAQAGFTTLRMLGSTRLLELDGAAPFVSIAAGGDQLLASNGHTVYSVGKLSSLSHPAIPEVGMFQVEKCLELGDEGVTSLATAGGAAAVVSGAGRLWLWGTVLSQEDAVAELQRADQEGFGHWAFSSTAPTPGPVKLSPGDAPWAGLGSPTPAVVPGLHNVTKVALGGGHVLAEVA